MNAGIPNSVSTGTPSKLPVFFILVNDLNISTSAHIMHLVVAGIITFKSALNVFLSGPLLGVPIAVKSPP